MLLPVQHFQSVKKEPVLQRQRHAPHDHDRGLKDFKRTPGERVTFRYRFVFYADDEKTAKIAERYQRYAPEEGTKSTSGATSRTTTAVP